MAGRASLSTLSQSICFAEQYLVEDNNSCLRYLWRPVTRRQQSIWLSFDHMLLKYL